MIVSFLFTLVVLSGKVEVFNNKAQKVYGQENLSTIAISEVMPNPIGDDSLYEWIELINVSDDIIELNSWKIDGKAIPNITIQPSQIIILARNKSEFVNLYAANFPEINLSDVVFEVKFELTNSSKTVKLVDSLNNVIDQVSYTNSSEGVSFERIYPSILCTELVKTNSEIKHTMLLINFQEENECIPITPSPTVEPVLTSTPTSIPTNTPTSIPTNSPVISPTILPTTITITPTPTPTPTPTSTTTPVPSFTSIPTTTPTLTEVSQTINPTTTQLPTLTPTQINVTITATQIEENFKENQKNLIITEIYSSPNSGEIEWIELFNTSSELKIDLSGMYVKDRSNSTNSYGNTKSYLPNIVINPNTYLVIEDPKISLNNNGDEIWLFSYSNQIIDKIKYRETDRGISNIRIWNNNAYILDYYEENNNEDGFLPQTKKITKGEQNILENIVEENLSNNQNRTSTISNTTSRVRATQNTRTSNNNNSNTTQTNLLINASSNVTINRDIQFDDQIKIFELENTSPNNNQTISTSVIFLISSMISFFSWIFLSDVKNGIFRKFRENFELVNHTGKKQNFF